jgi:hypothetical protein
MSSDISFKVFKKNVKAKLPTFLTSVRNREESEPQASQPISRRRMRRGRLKNQKGHILAIGSRSRPYPIWGRGFGWALLLLGGSLLFVVIISIRDQSLPQLPYSSALAQVR